MTTEEGFYAKWHSYFHLVNNTNSKIRYPDEYKMDNNFLLVAIE